MQDYLIPAIALIAIGAVLLAYNVISRRRITRDQEALMTASVICTEIVSYVEDNIVTGEEDELWKLVNEAQDILYAR